MMFTKKPLAALVAAASAMVLSSVSLAQNELEELVVVGDATKVGENLLDVSKAVNRFTSDDLDKGGVQDVSRLELITPGLAFAQRGNDFKLTLRGANAENTDRAESI